MWSDRLGNWYANCWIGDHYNTRGVRGGMTAGQVITYVENHVKRQHPEIREHNWSILLSLPTKLMGAITGWSPYQECSNCGQRRPRVVGGGAES
jgi:hypothetical protein